MILLLFDFWNIILRKCEYNFLEADMEFMSVRETAVKWDISQRRGAVLCTEEKAVRPFLKWAGGKGQLLKEIEAYYPFDNEKIT